MRADGSRIVDAQDDDAVFELLSSALNERVPSGLLDDLDSLVAQLQQLPPGLRAMAATHQLDVSMSLDDLGWHFANWHHHAFAEETARGLRELGAVRAAELFETAHTLALPYWSELGSDGFKEWYLDSALDRALDPLNKEMWELCESYGRLGLLSLWVQYARRNPNLLSESPGFRTNGCS